jgi:hypothetical protein
MSWMKQHWTEYLTKYSEIKIFTKLRLYKIHQESVCLQDLTHKYDNVIPLHWYKRNYFYQIPFVKQRYAINL